LEELPRFSSGSLLRLEELHLSTQGRADVERLQATWREAVRRHGDEGNDSQQHSNAHEHHRRKNLGTKNKGIDTEKRTRESLEEHRHESAWEKPNDQE
jgi:hypothetical protein